MVLTRNFAEMPVVRQGNTALRRHFVAPDRQNRQFTCHTGSRLASRAAGDVAGGMQALH
jgi:hypothetical protein